MNTLKRAFTAALVCVLLLTMLVVPTLSADFTDSGAIINREAVETLAALNIIKGKEDGSYFDPAATVTRAELTKMICVALNGGKELLMGTAAPTYADTAAHWAASYIEYCTRLGIVSGRGGGLFDPNAAVTGTEAAKMLLVAIGYNAADEGFMGVNWAVSVNIRAALKEFYENLEYLTPSGGLTRDNAAQMVYNAIHADMVEYAYTLVTINGVLTTLAAAKDISPSQTVITDKYKATIRYGVLTDISGGSLSITPDGRAESVTAAYTKVGKDHSALLGQYVKVISRADDEVIGVVAAGENKTVSTAVSAITSDGGRVKFSGVSYPLHNGTSGNITVLADGITIGSKAASYFVNGLSYDEVTFVDNNGDGGYEYAVVTRRTPAKVSYISATELIAGGIAYRYGEHSIESGLVKGDMVTVTVNLFAKQSYISKIEPITGTINAYRDLTNDEYRIGDVWYHANGTLTGMTLGDTAQLFAVNGVIFYAKRVDPTTLADIVMVLAVDSPTALVRRAKLLMPNGTNQIVTIDRDSVDAVIPAPGALYTYTETNYGCKFKTAAAAGNNAYTAAPVAAAIGGSVGTIGGTAILDTAVIFVWDAATSNGKVITGKQLKTLPLDTAVSAFGIGAYSASVGGLSRITMAALSVGTDGVLPSVGDPAEQYALIVDSAYQISADTITYKLWDGKSVVTVKEENTGVMAARTQISLIRYSAITDGVIRDAAAAGESRGAVIGMIDNEVSFDGSNMKRLTAETMYLYYDSGADSAGDIGKSSGTLSRADEIEGVYLENVKYVLDGSDVAFLLIDVNNKLSDATTYAAALTDASGNTTVTFRDVYGSPIASGASLSAGAMVNVTITATAAASVEVVFSGARCCPSGLGSAYTSGDDIIMDTGDVITMTFVVSGTASIVIQAAA